MIGTAITATGMVIVIGTGIETQMDTAITATIGTSIIVIETTDTAIDAGDN